MRLSSNMFKIHDAFGARGVFDVFAKVGIEGIDFNNDFAEYRTNEHSEQFYRDLSKYAEAKGIAVCQAHAPFPSSFTDEEKTAKRFDEIVLAMKNAAYLGAPMIVVHPCTHLDFSIEGNPEILFEYNLNFYRRLIPYAEKFGIKIAIENIDRLSVTSTPERLNRLYDTLDNPVFTVCFDVGHCLFEGVNPAEAIRKVGDRLVNGCTHIHDNCGASDDHTLPYYGKADWESVMKALAEIGYAGDLSYEAGLFIINLPSDVYEDALRYMASIGRHLISRFEYYKNNR